EPEVLRLLAPQRGLIATGQSQKQDLVSYRPARVFVIGVKRTPGFVELLLPPRQSRGISLRIRCPASVSHQTPRVSFLIGICISDHIWSLEGIGGIIGSDEQGSRNMISEARL